MLTIENRLQKIEDRAALRDVLTAYCTAVDSLSDMDGLLNCFTEDAVFDLSGISLPRFDGDSEIRKFFRVYRNGMENFAFQRDRADAAAQRADGNSRARF